MSVEELHTHVIRCNGYKCDESFADVVSTLPENIRQFAVRDGWEESESGRYHFCPGCKAKRRARRMARDLQNQIVEVLK